MEVTVLRTVKCLSLGSLMNSISNNCVVLPCLPSVCSGICQDVEFTDRSLNSQYVTAACQVVYDLGN